MDISGMLGKIPEQLHCRSGNILIWKGEPRFAKLEAMLEGSLGIEEPGVEDGRGEGRCLRILFPLKKRDGAGIGPALDMGLAEAQSKGASQIGLALDSFIEGPLGKAQADELYRLLLERMDAGLQMDIALISMANPATLRGAASRLFMHMEDQGGNIYKWIHPEGSGKPLQDSGGTLDSSFDAGSTAGEHGSWRVRYTVSSGLGEGSELVFAIVHPSDWERPQFVLPSRSGFSSVKSDGDASLLVCSAVCCGSKGFILHIRIRKGALKKGETIEILLGDRSGGAPGLKAQSTTKGRQILKLMGDLSDAVKSAWQHNDWTYVHPASPCFEVKAGAPFRYDLMPPSYVRPGEHFSGVLRVTDRMGNLCPGIDIKGHVLLPDSVKIPFLIKAGAPHSSVRVEGLRLDEPGVHRLQIVDSEGRILGRSSPVKCAKILPKRRIFWGDLHMHSELSDGTGSPEDVYGYARDVTSLEIAALGDHDFIMAKAGPGHWIKVKEQAAKWNCPGKFVTLLGYEYTERKYGGDRNVYFNSSDAPLIDCVSCPKPEELYSRLRQLRKDSGTDSLVIPHCCAATAEVWDYSDPELCPLAEIYSVHGDSDDYPNERPLHAFAEDFNLYGAPASYQGSFKHGLRMGAVGGTDDHSGQPGWGYRWHDYRGGIMGVFAESLERASVWEALKGRRTIATTGERIILELRIGGLDTGEEGLAEFPPALEVEAHGTSKIDMIEIIRDGSIIHCYHCLGEDESRIFVDREFQGEEACYRVRLTQCDGEMAWSSPIWARRNRLCSLR